MNPIQRFFLVVALIGSLILYVAGFVLMTPPIHASLFAKETAVVSAATLETRRNNPPALPVIDIRTASGDIALLQGHRWMETADANTILAAYPIGASVEAVRYNNKLWRGLSGLRDTVLLIVSALGAFIAFFGLWMVWKVRTR